MKKRLLITSIVMMLVIAVALSTATYAWFTSNNSVTASSLTMTAASNNAAALGIGWVGGEAGSQLSFVGSASDVQPMAPATLTAGTTESTVGFETATVKSVEGHLVFNTPTPATPFIFNNGASENRVSAFYVSNLSTANSVANIQVQATITGTSEHDGANLIRIGIFKRDTAGAGVYKLVGVLSSAPGATTVAYGDVAVGANAEKGTGQSLSYGASVDYIDLGSLTANDSQANGTDQIDLVAVVWMDGFELNDDEAGNGATISLTFYAAPSGSKYAG